jgi:hypothetical protein
MARFPVPGFWFVVDQIGALWMLSPPQPQTTNHKLLNPATFAIKLERIV